MEFPLGIKKPKKKCVLSTISHRRQCLWRAAGRAVGPNHCKSPGCVGAISGSAGSFKAFSKSAQACSLSSSLTFMPRKSRSVARLAKPLLAALSSSGFRGWNLSITRWGFQMKPHSSGHVASLTDQYKRKAALKQVPRKTDRKTSPK